MRVITASSSMVHNFPRALLEHPAVKEFMNVFVPVGFVGKDLGRSACTTIAITQEQKLQFKKMSEQVGYETNIHVDMSEDSVFVMYGDEYSSVAEELMRLVHQAAEDLNLSVWRNDFH